MLYINDDIIWAGGAGVSQKVTNHDIIKIHHVVVHAHITISLLGHQQTPLPPLLSVMIFWTTHPTLQL